MELYLVRHGQSQANADNQLAGWYDVPLTEKGVDEARAAGEKLRGIEFEKVYASDLMRACQTCENALPGIEYEKTALIREISVGEFEGLYYDQDSDDEKHRRFRNCDAVRDYSPGGGESHQDQLERVRTFLEMVPRRHAGNVAAFVHAGVLQCVLHVVLGQLYGGQEVAFPNAMICVLEWTGVRWRLKQWNP